ncbi:MAG: hypothetical protein ACK57G_09545 [Planctomycetota bacterium]|jgi:hypothetical protein
MVAVLPEVAGQVFTVHWSLVSSDSAGAALFVLWPAPMNHDVCFRDAGFTDFADADEAWDANAEGLLSRLLAEMSTYGEPRLVSAALQQPQPWFRSLFRKPDVFSLRDQISLPIQWDQLPDCVVEFGESGVSLRTGQGHHVFWITLPCRLKDAVPAMVHTVAGPHPVLKTELRWGKLAGSGRQNNAMQQTRDEARWSG